MRKSQLKPSDLSSTLLFILIVLLFVLPIPLGLFFLLSNPFMTLIDAAYIAYILGLTYFLLGSGGVLAFQRMSTFIEQNFSLPRNEARSFLRLLILGLPTLPPFTPSITVSAGQVDPDGPLILRKVGGPGFVTVQSDSVIVTCRGGYLYRILGSGFHKLEPFERIWDSIDLRPQQRETIVKAVTQDGILISTNVEVFFQIRGHQHENALGYAFNPSSILFLSTMKRYLGENNTPKIKSWPELVVGKVAGAVRNKLESMQLDDILAMHKKQHKESISPLAILSHEIEQIVRFDLISWDIYIERIHISPIKPQNKVISERWVQHWSTEWEQYIHSMSIKSKIGNWQEIEDLQLKAEFDLLRRIADGWTELVKSDLGEESEEALAQLLQMRFMDVLRSMAKEDPLVQMAVLEQAETLQEMLAASHTLPAEKEPPSSRPSALPEAPDGT